MVEQLTAIRHAVEVAQIVPAPKGATSGTFSTVRLKSVASHKSRFVGISRTMLGYGRTALNVR
jgi:hypothetical protein